MIEFDLVKLQQISTKVIDDGPQQADTDVSSPLFLIAAKVRIESPSNTMPL